MHFKRTESIQFFDSFYFFFLLFIASHINMSVSNRFRKWNRNVCSFILNKANERKRQKQKTKKKIEE